MQLVNCPRCGEQLKGGFYPYELPFMPVDSFEDILNELMEIAHKSPFVMLKHEFAESVFQAIQELAENAVPTEITQPLYRARAASQITEVAPKEFDVTQKHLLQRVGITILVYLHFTLVVTCVLVMKKCARFHAIWLKFV